MQIWMGAVSVCVAVDPFVCVALAAMPWRIEEASGFDGGGARRAAPGLRYMLSMVGRRAAPNGVLRKSVGRSMGAEMIQLVHAKLIVDGPLM